MIQVKAYITIAGYIDLYRFKDKENKKGKDSEPATLCRFYLSLEYRAKRLITFQHSLCLQGRPPKLVEGRDIVQACINAGTRLATEKRAGMITWEEVETNGRHKSINTSSSSSSSSSDSFATGPFSPQAIAFTVLALDSLMD